MIEREDRHSFVEFRRYWRHKPSGAIDTQLWRLVQSGMTLTLDPSYVGKETTRGSPFLEMETMQPSLTATDAVMEAFTLTRKYERDCDVLSSIDTAIDTTSDILTRYWLPDKHHVLLASGGYDSRILIALIKRLNLPGDYIAISNRWERDAFLRIVQAANETCFLIYDEGSEGSDGYHFAPSILDFPNAYRRLNAPCVIPGNQWWYLLEYGQHRDLLPDDEHIQLIGGYWHNELVDCFVSNTGGDALKTRFTVWYPYHVMASLPQKAGSVLFPFTHIEYVRLLNSFPFGMPSGDFRKMMADRLLPGVSDVPNPSMSDRGHPISDRLMKHAKDSYDNSWYGRHVRLRSVDSVNTNSNLSTWWSDWSMASLCEYARGIGANIIVQE